MNMRIFTNHLPILSILSIIFLFGGCLNRTETIVIDNLGNTTITAEFDGKEDDFEKTCSYPTKQLWEIIENKQYKDKDNNPKTKLEAEQIIKYGTPFYTTYTDELNSDISLQFPTKLEMWKDGKKTYYKFTRTYKARTFARFNGPGELDEFNKLEEKVLDKGIFNVTKQERNEYIQNLSLYFIFRNYYIFDEAIGLMIQNNNFLVQNKNEVGLKMQKLFESYVTEDRLLDIFRMDDSLMETEYNNMLVTIENQVAKLIADVTNENQSALDTPFQKALYKVRLNYKITEALTSDKFTVALQMPGEIISTNGFTEPEKSGEVYWEFSGDALQDRDIPLTALSVVEK